MELKASRIILENQYISDIKRLIVVKEGVDLHLEAIVETPHHDYSLRQLAEIKKDLATRLLQEPHVVDVNIEFMEEDTTQDWVDGKGSSIYKPYDTKGV